MIKNYHQFILENLNSKVEIENIQDSDIPEVLELCAKVFGDVDSAEGVKEYLGEATNFNISKKAIINNKIVGCYLFNTDSICDFLKNINCVKEDLSKYKNLKGIQGLGLAVLPEYRGSGIGKKLRDVPLKMGFDYVWGQHLKGLHNIDEWIKFGRRIVADGDIRGGDMYITLMDLKLNEEIKHIYQPDDISCGPTCLMMLADYYNIKTDIQKLTDACGTDELTGTTSEKMINGLNYLKLNYEQFPLKNKENAFNKLKKYRYEKYFILFRTLTKGIKHWILCDSYGDNFHIADPWLGEYNLSYDDLDKIWSPRDYDGFIVKGVK